MALRAGLIGRRTFKHKEANQGYDMFHGFLTIQNFRDSGLLHVNGWSKSLVFQYFSSRPVVQDANQPGPGSRTSPAPRLTLCPNVSISQETPFMNSYNTNQAFSPFSRQVSTQLSSQVTSRVKVKPQCHGATCGWDLHFQVSLFVQPCHHRA